MEISWIRGEQFRRQAKASSPLLDDCPACNTMTPLAYSGVGVARCRAGHVFNRCKLTLLPLIDPYWQKTCLDCELEFVDEHKHPEMSIRSTTDPKKLLAHDLVDNDSIRVRRSTGDVHYLYLANAVFDKFNHCPFCGGYFTG